MRYCWRLWSCAAYTGIIWNYLANANLFIVWHWKGVLREFSVEGSHMWLSQTLQNIKIQSKPTPQIPLPVSSG